MSELQQKPTTKESPLPLLRKAPQTEFETDVLVVGGGFSGVFAALKVAEKGQRVILVDKGIVGKSGYSPWAVTFRWFDESLGDKYEDYVNGFMQGSEYSSNLDYVKMWLDAGSTPYHDLLSMGVLNPTQEFWDPDKESARKYFRAHLKQDRHVIMRQKLVDSGIPIVERVMLTDLLMQDNRVVGAIGFWMESEEVIVFRAKAVILCTGAGSYMPVGFATMGCTFDGDAMAYRIGATVAGKEYVDFHSSDDIWPGAMYKMWYGCYVNPFGLFGGAQQGTGMGETLGMKVYKIQKDGYTPPPPMRGMPPGPPISPENPRKGLPPVAFKGHVESLNGAATGMGVHKSEGIWPVDTKCFSGIPGLYAAGDSLASMVCGAVYTGGMGTSSSVSVVQGARAAEAAAEYAAQTEVPRPSADEIARITDRLMAPLKREKGFNPRWLRDVLLTTMSPYYILYLKNKPRLEGALENVKVMREHIASKLRATNPHELRLCHEMENKVLNAEMKLRASLMRTESRGSHYREDYPARNDKEWLAWILIKQDSNGKMTLTKKTMPQAFVGDLSMPYKQRYPARFPGELEYLGLPPNTEDPPPGP